MAEKFVFLTQEWLVAARTIRDEMAESVSEPTQIVRMNQTITDAPFAEGKEILVHVDTTGMEFRIDEGHIDDPDVTITVDWFTAKSLIIDQDTQAAMSAFMSGRIDVKGDLMKIITMLAETPDPAAREVAARIREITAE